MENFINLLSDVWNRGFYGVNLSDVIISLVVLLVAFLLRGFIIATVLNAIGRIAAKIAKARIFIFMCFIGRVFYIY